MDIGDNLGLSELTSSIANLPTAAKVGAAAVLGVAGGVAGGALLASAVKKKRKKAKRKSVRKRANKHRYKKRRTKHTKRTSHKRIHYTRKGQPYVILRSGKARFIKKSSAKRSKKMKGGRY